MPIMYRLLIKALGNHRTPKVAGQVVCLPKCTIPSHARSFATTDHTILQESRKYQVDLYARPNDLLITKGKGCYLYDQHDTEYLDFTAGIAVVALGHSDPDVANVLYSAANNLVHTSNLYHNVAGGTLASLLVKSSQRVGVDISQVYLANSGTEANEAALKFARAVGKAKANDKTEFICFKGAFHGRTFGAVSATPNIKYQKPFEPLVPGFRVGSFNDLKSVEKIISEKTCGIILEPIQGEGGVRPATKEFLQGLRKLANQYNALLIFDEIQCGLGRTGELFAHSSSNVCPDLLTLAKPLANGIPIGAVLMNSKVSQHLNRGVHGTTFGGNPLASSVAIHVLNRIQDPSFLQHVKQMGAYLTSKCQELQKAFPDLITDIRGRGLMMGVEISDAISILDSTSNSHPKETKLEALVRLAREKHLLIVTAGGTTIRLVPPLIINSKQIDQAIGILKDCFSTITSKNK